MLILEDLGFTSVTTEEKKKIDFEVSLLEVYSTSIGCFYGVYSY